MPETWRPVPGFPDYDVSDQGRVRSWLNNRHGRRSTPRTIGSTMTNGYRIAKLRSRDGDTKITLVHRLVLTVFVGECPPNMEACHWDGDPANNHLENLRWDTKQSNAADRKRHGTFDAPYLAAAKRSRLSDDDVREIRALALSGISNREIAQRFGINHGYANRVINRKKRKYVD